MHGQSLKAIRTHFVFFFYCLDRYKAYCRSLEHPSSSARFLPHFCRTVICRSSCNRSTLSTLATQPKRIETHRGWKPAQSGHGRFVTLPRTLGLIFEILSDNFIAHAIAVYSALSTTRLRLWPSLCWPSTRLTLLRFYGGHISHSFTDVPSNVSVILLRWSFHSFLSLPLSTLHWTLSCWGVRSSVDHERENTHWKCHWVKKCLSDIIKSFFGPLLGSP